MRFMGPRYDIGDAGDVDAQMEIQTFGVELPQEGNGLVRIKDQDASLKLFIWLRDKSTERKVTVVTHMGAWCLKVTSPIGTFNVDFWGDITPVTAGCEIEHLNLQVVLRENNHLKVTDQDWIAITYNDGYTDKIYLPAQAKE